MPTPRGDHKGRNKNPTTNEPNQHNKTKYPTINYPESNRRIETKHPSGNDTDPNQGNELSDHEENSQSDLQTSLKDGTTRVDRRNIAKPSDENKMRLGKEHIFDRASEVFTMKLSIPALVVTIAMAVYLIRAQNAFETKFAVLMKYEEYLVKLDKLSKKVPSLEKGLFELEKQLEPIDERVVNLRSEMTTANDNWTNVQMRIKSMSEISSNLEVDLPQQQQRFIEITKNLESADNDISNFSKIFDSMTIKTTDITKNLEIAFQNQSFLNELLNKTTNQAEYVNTSVARVHTEMTEFNKHLPTLEKVNNSVTLILTSYHLFPQIKRRLDDNIARVYGLEKGVINIASRLNDLKESSENVNDAVSNAGEQQRNIEERVKLSNENLQNLQKNMLNANKTVQNSLTKLTEVLETTEGELMERTSKLKTDISETTIEIGSMVTKVDEYNGKLEDFKSNVVSLSNDVNKMKSFENYTGPKVRELDIQVRNLQSQNTGLFQPINVCVALAFILIAALFYMTYYRYDDGGMQLRDHERTESHSTPPFMSQRAPNILDSIQRVPVFDNKVCVVSFYSETMNLHKQLVKSALATHKRGGNIEIIQHLVRRHEDIPNIPGARYIFVFVDFNERNVILENPGQDLGDKKLVTVQAAQKLGANVFVTYVRDRGSNQLLPGNLYNQELSAFTSHQVLRGLENKQRCFSVYETFNTTQKESIVRSIS